jgi:hypothetical protein
MANCDVEGLADHSGVNSLCIFPAKVAALLRRADRFHLFASR